MNFFRPPALAEHYKLFIKENATRKEFAQNHERYEAKQKHELSAQHSGHVMVMQ
jgi:hypothetical protein